MDKYILKVVYLSVEKRIIKHRYRMPRILLLISALLLHTMLTTAGGFSFALITDMHIDVNNPANSRTLAQIVNEINATNEIEFVLIAGDTTDRGDSLSFAMVNTLLSKLSKPWYITFGNHDVLSDKPGSHIYNRVFKTDKFCFTAHDFLFAGLSSYPETKNGNGHISSSDITWLKNELQKAGREIPFLFVTHYPLQTGDVDNWFEVTDLIRDYNVQLILNGHYHRNALLNYDELPGIVNRTSQSKDGDNGAYTLYTINSSIQIAVKKTGLPAEVWMEFPVEKREYGKSNPSLR